MKLARRAWAGSALLLLNSLVLFLLLNLGACAMLSLLPKHGTPRIEADRLTDLYPEYSSLEIELLLEETWGRSYRYEPFTQFRERAASGTFVNVHEAGFRVHSSDQPWPPNPRAPRPVFVFGGSTSFGYGETDYATIPYALQELLRERCEPALWVYNFGRSNYFSSQERILFEQLARQGARPAIAIFIDGINEFLYPTDAPKFTDRLTYLMEERGLQLWRRAIGTLPLVEALRRVVSPRVDSFSGGATDLDNVIQRWEANREIIESVAASKDIATLFVWQPTPAYAYAASNHSALEIFGGPLPHEEKIRGGYTAMKRSLARTPPRSNVLWLADYIPDLSSAHYIDRFHYSGAFAHALAAQIANRLEPLVCEQDRDPIVDLG